MEYDTKAPESDDTYVAAFAHQQGGSTPNLPYGEDVSPTLISHQTMAVLIYNHGQAAEWHEEKNGVCQTLTAIMGQGGNNTPFVIENAPIEEPQNDNNTYIVTDASHTQICTNQSPTLTARDYKDPHLVSRPKSIVRRLTPLECERLQGFPDDWTSSVSDSERYKALGNSVALPCVDYIMSGVADVLDY